jgi:anti-sigma factor RsiW
MMTTTHMDDGALVRWLDGEALGEERHALAAHLTACAACEARLAAIRDRAARVSRELVALDGHAARPLPRRSAWALRAAAGFAVLLGVGMAVEPVRAWILERADHVWTVVAGERGNPPVAPDQTAPAAAPAAGSITFVPAGDVFVLEVTSRQAGGEVVIETVGTGTASATVTGGTGAESFVVLPAGLRIVNDAASRAEYLVQVPGGLSAIVLAVADGPRRRYQPAGAGERWTVPLGPVAETGGIRR